MAQQLTRHLLVQRVVFGQQQLQHQGETDGRIGGQRGCSGLRQLLMVPHAHQHVFECGGQYRFGQEGRKRSGIHLVGRAAQAAADQDAGGAVLERQCTDLLPGLGAVQARHQPVGEHQLVGVAEFVGLCHRLHGLRAGRHRIGTRSQVGEHVGQQLTGLLHVVHYQDAGAGGQGLHMLRCCSLGADAKRRLKPEGAALAWLAAHTHLPVHQFGQAARDGQPQAGAAVAAGGGDIGLLKRQE